MFPLDIKNKCKMPVVIQTETKNFNDTKDLKDLKELKAVNLDEPIINGNYVPVKTKGQIKALLTSSSKDKTIKMLNKFFEPTNWVKYSKESKNDEKFLLGCRPYVIKSLDKGDRAQNRVDSLSKLALENEKTKVTKEYKYLDLGSTDGQISYAIGKSLGLSKDQIIAADVPGWEDVNSKVINQGVTNIIIKATGPLPFTDNTFDLITVFMVLHHIEDVKSRIAEIYRILKPGGTLIIREHDCDNDYTRMLCDLEHSIYDVGVLELPNKTFFDTYKAWYRSRDQWASGLKSYGFKLIKDEGKTWNTATRAYHEVYSK